MNTKQEKSADRLEETVKDGVLIVDADQSAARLIVSILETDGFKTTWLTDAAAAINLLKEQSFALILCDHATSGMNGLEFLRAIKAMELGTMAVVMSESGGIDTALEAIKLGACDFITKPVNAIELLLTIRKAQERERLRLENEILKSQVAKRYSFSNIIAKSPVMLEIFETVKKIADYKTTILLYGESGTGKELIAKALHHNSVRRNKRFVALNCGAIPENLLESELFGHKRGSFTDALRDKKGLFEEADGGTILLDEIGELPMHLQVKILRVLQENEIRPVGDSRIIPINVRVIAATLRDLENDILEGRFRDDLFYRLNVITLRIPPLR